MLGNKTRTKGGKKGLKPSWLIRLEKDIADLESDPFIQKLINFPDGPDHPEKIGFKVKIILS